MTQTYNNCAETHLGGGVEPFCLPVVRHRSSARSGSVALRKGSQRFCPHHSDLCRALMLTCQNSLWQCCERFSNVFPSFFCFGRHGSLEFDQLNSVVITWRALIGMSHKLAAFNYPSSLALWTTLDYELGDAIGKVRVEPATRSAVDTWRIKKTFWLSGDFLVWYFVMLFHATRCVVHHENTQRWT